MVYDFKYIKDDLPNDLPELMYLALNNFKKCYLDPNYEVNNSLFHLGGDICKINLQGALMLNTSLQKTDFCTPQMLNLAIQKKIAVVGLVMQENLDKAEELMGLEFYNSIDIINPSTFKVIYDGDIDKYSNEVINLIQKLEK